MTINQISGTNVNEGLAVAMNVMFKHGPMRNVSPRGMKTIELEGVTVVQYQKPEERVLFGDTRDANPFFHLMEAMWILAGRDDVAFPKFLLKKFGEYSDDGIRFHGAYGARLKPQLGNVVDELRRDPQSRRAVAAIWQPSRDSGYTGKDMPCNLALTFKVRDRELHMTVYNRSNDLVWGALGANAVQFPFIAEYVAAHLDIQTFHMTQVTDSMHLYPENSPAKELLEKGHPYYDPYLGGVEIDGRMIYPYVQSLVELGEDEDVQCVKDDLKTLFGRFDAYGVSEIPSSHEYRSYFIRDVVSPMWDAIITWKSGEYLEALNKMSELVDQEDDNVVDWHLAGYLWMFRRIQMNLV